MILKKNLALTIPHSQALRLLTDVLPINKITKEYDLYIICENTLVTERIENFCKKEKIFLLSFEFRKISGHNFIKRFLRNVRAFVFPFKYKNQTLLDFWKTFKYQKENRDNYFRKFTIILIYQLSCRFKIMRNYFSIIEKLFSYTRLEENLLKKNNIKYLLTTSFSGVDANDQFLLAAQRIKIFSFTYIGSWDNPSGNGFNLCKPNRVLSYSESMSKQIKEFQDIKNKNINVVGALQYANWFNYRRDVKPLKNKLKILYGGKSYKRFSYDYTYVKEIIKVFEYFESPIELSVRPHPFALIKNTNGDFFYDEIYKLFELSESYDYVNLDFEKVGKNNYYVDNKSFDRMRDNLLKYDLIINSFTTLALESCILNIPCINIYYETEDYKFENYPTRRNIYQDARSYHNTQLNKAVPSIGSFDSLKKYINSFLNNQNKYLSESLNVARYVVGDLEKSEEKFLNILKKLD